MPGEAIVTIRDRQWLVSMATTPYELMTGLGGLPYLEPGTGMLFDAGAEHWIEVTTEPMLFPIDIVFISGDLAVMKVFGSVEPGQVLDPEYAHYWLEVNAGEAEGMAIGDPVAVELLAAPAQDWTSLITSWGIGILGTIMAFSMLGVVLDMTIGTAKPGALPSREERLLPQTGRGSCYICYVHPETRNVVRMFTHLEYERAVPMVKRVAQALEERYRKEVALWVERAGPLL